jgi:hypothetical protein
MQPGSCPSQRRLGNERAENFVARWSRLKRETGKQGSRAMRRRRDAGSDRAQQGVPPGFGRAAAGVRPASLRIRSITAGSDAALCNQVPPGCNALRRAWTTDPAIATSSVWPKVGGTSPTRRRCSFRPLEATDDVRRRDPGHGTLGLACERG